MIRKAVPSDAAAVQAIWNALIQDTTVTFNSLPKTAEDVAAFIANQPVFVADRDGVVGFASYGPFRTGIGYARIAEHSIVLTRSAQGSGLGRGLMNAVSADAKAQGIHSLMAGISGENDAGIGFHTRLGFKKVGHIVEAGFKFDRFIDLILMQKHL